MGDWMPLMLSTKSAIMRLFCPDCDKEVERVSIPGQVTSMHHGYGYRCVSCGWESGLQGVEYVNPAPNAAAAAPEAYIAGWSNRTTQLVTCTRCFCMYTVGAAHRCPGASLTSGGG